MKISYNSWGGGRPPVITRDVAEYVQGALWGEDHSCAFGRLVDVLTTKEILTAEDVVHIAGTADQDPILHPE